eukprot:PhM_4_TR9411/c0_g1_i1/m.54787
MFVNVTLTSAEGTGPAARARNVHRRGTVRIVVAEAATATAVGRAPPRGAPASMTMHVDTGHKLWGQRALSASGRGRGRDACATRIARTTVFAVTVGVHVLTMIREVTTRSPTTHVTRARLGGLGPPVFVRSAMTLCAADTVTAPRRAVCARPSQRRDGGQTRRLARAMCAHHLLMALAVVVSRRTALDMEHVPKQDAYAKRTPHLATGPSLEARARSAWTGGLGTVVCAAHRTATGTVYALNAAVNASATPRTRMRHSEGSSRERPLVQNAPLVGRRTRFVCVLQITATGTARAPPPKGASATTTHNAGIGQVHLA